jgi:hypothetical protein
MKQVLGYLAAFVLVFAVILGVGWIAQGNDFFMFKVFAPKYEAVRRDTFEQSKAYNQGMIQELQNMQFAYVAEKDPEAKAALASVILHRAADYNMDDARVPGDLRDFVNKLKRERTEAQ